MNRVSLKQDMCISNSEPIGYNNLNLRKQHLFQAKYKM